MAAVTDVPPRHQDTKDLCYLVDLVPWWSAP